MIPKIHSKRFPSIQHLLVFETAARLQSFTLTAQALAQTQSAVSKQILALESELGRRLFERKGRKLSLTLAGEELVREVPRWLAEGERILGLSKARRTTAGPLRMACLPTLGALWLASRLTDFMARHSEVELTVDARTLPFDFSATPYELAVHYGSEHWPGARLHRLFGEVRIAVATPELARRIRKPADVVRHRWIAQSSRVNAFTIFTEQIGLGKAARSVHPLVSALRSGLGLALVPERWVAADLASGALVPLLDYRHQEQGAYWVATPDTRNLSPACLAFRDWMLQQAADESQT
jgi:LysR family transcriptional regulator, glycine cleavage system transcriptional activator